MLEPRAEILTSILDAYTHLGALQWGEAIHGFFIRNLFYRSMEETTHMETSILNMYAYTLLSDCRSLKVTNILDKISGELIQGIVDAGKKVRHTNCGESISRIFGFSFTEGPVHNF
uniref:Uncharacterized protein n=1 Tax=Quercus lobata TaxID=97700 RepID=A0A7N2RDA7_QUELO